METDNSTTQTTDNGAAQTDTSSAAAATTTETTATAASSAGWKGNLRTDLRDSPLLSKFDDNPDGLNKAIESHANLEKLLGHEKVPIPKDANDVEGWNRFSKAMGIPDKAEGYGLPDMAPPGGNKEMGIDKAKFAEVVHAHKLTPAQAKGLWKTYNDMNAEVYNRAVEAHQKVMTETVNKLKSEWGDAYQANVELGQMVINKFSDSQETNDYITSVLSKSPEGIKFLAKIGDQFAENKVGEFSMKRFTLAPDQAMEEVRKASLDVNGPYMNAGNKFTEREHQAEVDRINSLIASAQRAGR